MVHILSPLPLWFIYFVLLDLILFSWTIRTSASATVNIPKYLSVHLVRMKTLSANLNATITPEEIHKDSVRCHLTSGRIYISLSVFRMPVTTSLFPQTRWPRTLMSLFFFRTVLSSLSIFLWRGGIDFLKMGQNRCNIKSAILTIFSSVQWH